MEVMSKEKEAGKVIEIGELLGVSFGNNEDDFVRYIAEIMEVSDVGLNQRQNEVVQEESVEVDAASCS